jgi:uncharacterized phage protein gp47/JayE
VAYVDIDYEVVPENLALAAHDLIQQRWPDWEPNEANLETWLIDAFARLAAEVGILGKRAAFEIFKGFGATIMNLPPDVEEQATVSSTWTAEDNAGYTIAAGTVVIVEETGDESYAFEVVSDVVIPPGSTATAAGEVTLRAVAGGASVNGVGGAGVTAVVADAYGYVSTVTLTGEASGGQDEETEEDYVNRLSDELQLMTPRPILPRDFEVLALRNQAVSRVKAVDGWNPTAGTTGNERYIGLVLLDEDGADVAGGVKTEVETELDAMREVNFVVDVGSPTFTAIDVTATVRCYAGSDPTQVDAAVTAAVENYLSPSNWGRPSTGHADLLGDWVNTDKVRMSEMYAAINSVEGVNYVESLTIEGGTADVNLSGVVPVTQPGTIAITANSGP